MCIAGWRRQRRDRRELLLFTQEAPQNRVHQTGSTRLAELARRFDSLIDDGVRRMIRKGQLMQRYDEQRSQLRLLLCARLEHL